MTQSSLFPEGLAPSPSTAPSDQVTFSAIVTRVTFHNPETGWAVLKVAPHQRPGEIWTVTVHHTQIFAGATLELSGQWVENDKYGPQFKAKSLKEKKPATTAALEKYLGSGLIKGVGPKTARKIVKHFKDQTLDIFDTAINRLREVPGIADIKKETIKESWQIHREISRVTIFLQNYGISTLFAVKIYKTYGEKSIEVVKENPYRLAKDIYGIGFFSADRVALSLGFHPQGPERIRAAINHILDSSREEGHCYLTAEQILENTCQLIQAKEEQGLKEEETADLKQKIEQLIISLVNENEIISKQIRRSKGSERVQVYYSRSLFFAEHGTAKLVSQLMNNDFPVDHQRVEKWVNQYCQKKSLQLSEQQKQAVRECVRFPVGVLTGGPGCGKTTTTAVIVALLRAMGKKIQLAAPTGRAAQRMAEVIGIPAKTIHRLLIFNPANGGFKHNEENPLDVEYLILDECSMLDITLTFHLLKAIPTQGCQVLFIGDADQLPSVGPGSVFKDFIQAKVFGVWELTQVFRQAQDSQIITYAHEINRGKIPKIPSPFARPSLWKTGEDCLFCDSEQLTKEQAKFITKIRALFSTPSPQQVNAEEEVNKIYSEGEEGLDEKTLLRDKLVVPKKFEHVDPLKIVQSRGQVEELKNILKKVHPWSSLHYGLTCSDLILKLYLETIPKYLGPKVEIQILTPMTRGGLGTKALNPLIQEKANPQREGLSQVIVGGRLFRAGDRVIQRRNNYELGVFNGDIGKVVECWPIDMVVEVKFEGDRTVQYKKDNLLDLELAYAITIHKSQGSEFEVVLIPIMTQHFKLLFRNLIYTGLTRAKKLVVFVGTRKALNLGVLNIDARTRQTALVNWLRSGRNQASAPLPPPGNDHWGRGPRGEIL